VGTPLAEKTVNFRRVHPNGEYRVLRLLSETDLWELGLSPYAHGMRLRMGRAGRRPSVFDLCCGHESLRAAHALAGVVAILRTIPESSSAAGIDSRFPWAGTRPDLALHGAALYRALQNEAGDSISGREALAVIG